jgi:hypothetical protein
MPSKWNPPKARRNIAMTYSIVSLSFTHENETDLREKRWKKRRERKDKEMIYSFHHSSFLYTHIDITSKQHNHIIFYDWGATLSLYIYGSDGCLITITLIQTNGFQ